MSDLAELYHRAPRPDSPDRLDNRVLSQAQLMTPVKRRTAGSPLWLPAVSVVCAAVLGLTLVLRYGAPPLSDTGIESPTHTDAAPPKAPAETAGKATLLSAEQGMSVDSTALLPDAVGDQVLTATEERAQVPPAAVVHPQRGVEREAVTSDPAASVLRNKNRRIISRLSVAERQPEDGLSATNNAVVASAGETSDGSVNDWLASQPAHYFTVLIAKATNRSVLEKLAAQHGLRQLPPDTVILKSDRFGWVYIAGSFKTRDAAAKQLQQLKFIADADIVNFKTLKSEWL